MSSFLRSDFVMLGIRWYSGVRAVGIAKEFHRARKLIGVKAVGIYRV